MAHVEDEYQPAIIDHRGLAISKAILAGLLAGGVAAILDLRQAIWGLDSGFEKLLLCLQAVGRLGLAGMLISTAVVCLALMGRRLAPLIKQSETSMATTAITSVAAIGLIALAYHLFQGGRMRLLPGRFVLIGITAAVFVIVFWLLTRAILRVVQAADRGRLTRGWVIIICTVLISAALGARWCDAHLFRRLYLYLHTTLGAVTLGGFAMAFRILLARGTETVRFRKWGGLIAGGVVVLYVGAAATFDLRQTVRAAAYNHTATLADVLRVTARPIRPGMRPKPSTPPITLQRELRRRVLPAENGQWPAFPDAHVVLITIDALRADRMGVYGHRHRDLTPNLDQWAREKGVVFERAYTTAPHSSYAISALHASRYIYDEAMLNRDIQYPTLADAFNARSYETAAHYTKGIFFTEGNKVGHYRRSKFGFGKVTHGNLPPEDLTDEMIGVIDRVVTIGEPPTFLWVHYFNLHEPYESTRYGVSPTDRYDGEIRDADEAVIRLIRHIEATLQRNAIVVITADHGEEFEDHGGCYHGSSLYDEQVRVPFIIAVPGIAPKRVRAPISVAAAAPTVLHLVDITPPPTMLGQDLRPGIFGGDEKHMAQPVFASVMHHHLVLDWPWKLIADPSQEIYELYNLATDPKERANRFDREKSVAKNLLQTLYAWLDTIGQGEDDARTALNLGQMHDPRSVPRLKQVAENNGAPAKERVQAIRLLGEMRIKSAKPLLRTLLSDASEAVALAAALTLGEVGDMSGLDLVYDALFDIDPELRDRAGLILGQHRDRAATPALVEALGRDDVGVREKAIRALGRLQDKTAVPHLLEALVEERTRYLVVLALGKIGDARAYDALIDVLDHDRFQDVRGYAVVALGWLGLEKAIPRLIRVLRDEPEIKWTAESLVRLGAVGEAPLFGTDVAQGMGSTLSGFTTCKEKPPFVDGAFLNRTACRTAGNSATLRFFAFAPNGATVILRARHLLKDNRKTPLLTIRVDGAQVGKAPLLGKFQEVRLQTNGNIWTEGKHVISLHLDRNGPFELDHFLVLAN
ncbi:MAG: sulfatase-like hydrolase/transferase [Myxococcota bacterium]|nr:sulfatase-like hydrolase/transferase [Myxococcota bacterium]